MGACLELAAQWRGVWACAAPVASYYEGDINDLAETLVDPKHAIPWWFFHSNNDTISAYEPIERLAKKLQEDRKDDDNRLTSFEDSWSNNGHLADTVAYPAVADEPGRLALGGELFEWMLAQRCSHPVTDIGKV